MKTFTDNEIPVPVSARTIKQQIQDLTWRVPKLRFQKLLNLKIEHSLVCFLDLGNEVLKLEAFYLHDFILTTWY